MLLATKGVKMKYKTIIDQLSLEDKVALCSGADFFSTKPFEKYGNPSITMEDGPHGIRKRIAVADHSALTKVRRPHISTRPG
jgi:beta-glucosidase